MVVGTVVGLDRVDLQVTVDDAVSSQPIILDVVVLKDLEALVF
jgi:hypothetical protein